MFQYSLSLRCCHISGKQFSQVGWCMLLDTLTVPSTTSVLRDGKQYYDYFWTVLTRSALCLHRPLHCHKRCSLFHQSELQTCASCSVITLLSQLYSPLQWVLIQKLMLKLISASFWTMLLAHFCKTTLCLSEIILSQYRRNDLRKQNNASTWNWLLQMAYFLGFISQRPYETPSSHNDGTGFHLWQDDPGWNLISSSDAYENIQIYGMLA